MNIYDALCASLKNGVQVAYNVRLNLCVSRYSLPKRPVFYHVAPLAGPGRIERHANIDCVIHAIGYNTGDDWQVA